MRGLLLVVEFLGLEEGGHHFAAGKLHELAEGFEHENCVGTASLLVDSSHQFHIPEDYHILISLEKHIEVSQRLLVLQSSTLLLILPQPQACDQSNTGLLLTDLQSQQAQEQHYHKLHHNINHF